MQWVKFFTNETKYRLIILSFERKKTSRPLVRLTLPILTFIDFVTVLLAMENLNHHNLIIISVCPIGSFLNAGSCDECPANTYSRDINANSCMNCPTGTDTQQLTGQISCGMTQNWWWSRESDNVKCLNKLQLKDYKTWLNKSAADQSTFIFVSHHAKCFILYL